MEEDDDDVVWGVAPSSVGVKLSGSHLKSFVIPSNVGQMRVGLIGSYVNDSSNKGVRVD